MTKNTAEKLGTAGGRDHGRRSPEEVRQRPKVGDLPHVCAQSSLWTGKHIISRARGGFVGSSNSHRDHSRRSCMYALTHVSPRHAAVSICRYFRCLSSASFPFPPLMHFGIYPSLRPWDLFVFFLPLRFFTMARRRVSWTQKNHVFGGASFSFVIRMLTMSADTLPNPVLLAASIRAAKIQHSSVVCRSSSTTA